MCKKKTLISPTTSSLTVTLLRLHFSYKLNTHRIFIKKNILFIKYTNFTQIYFQNMTGSVY